MRVCSHCGADVPPRASACGECGSDAETGWADESTRHDALWGGFDEDDYRDAVAGLPGGAASTLPRWVLATAVIVLIAFLALLAL